MRQVLWQEAEGNTDTLLPVFQWFEGTAVGTAIRNSIWAFPVIEAVHLFGLCLLGGALLVVDMRMLGVGLPGQRIATIARHARPWLVRGVALMVVTGLLLFSSEAVKCYYNTSFWVKITTLPFALAFTFGVRERFARDEQLDTSARSRAIGATSIALWFVVAAAGRWIGFS
jgi:hypothetical protein